MPFLSPGHFGSKLPLSQRLADFLPLRVDGGRGKVGQPFTLQVMLVK